MQVVATQVGKAWWLVHFLNLVLLSLGGHCWMYRETCAGMSLTHSIGYVGSAEDSQGRSPHPL